jgi:site-specific recombinase XerD
MEASHLLIKSFHADMLLRGYRPRTILAYCRCVRKYLAHAQSKPGDFGETHAKAFLFFLVRDQEASPAEHKMHAAALKCFYEYTLDLPDVARRIPIPKVPQSLPDVLSGTEVDTLLLAVEPLKYRVVIVLTYAGGLRIEEACALRTTDIDSKRMMIHVHLGKGGKDRCVMLSERLLVGLREYYRLERPGLGFLFPGQNPGTHVHQDTVRERLRDAVLACGLGKRATPHILRHCFATHLLETGTELRVIQALLGHASIRTTVRYTRVSRDVVARTTSPYDVLGTEAGKKALG